VSERTVRVGLLGCGTVGGALATLLLEHAEDIQRRAGCRLEIGAVAVRDLTRSRPAGLDASLFTTDPWSVVGDPSLDVICELMGGIDPARELILGALKAGKPVVTANKEVLASHAAELFAAAAVGGLDLYLEAAVAGGIPLIRPMKESLAGDRVTRVTGIVNGTTNYILSRMADDGASFADALAQAQSLGFAEADPTADVEGFDAAAKLAIIASIAFNTRIVTSDVFREGITGVSAEDITFAKKLGYAVKLLAVAELEGEAVSARVHPAMIPLTHPLASVGGAFNAVFVEAASVGELMFYGRGAGGDPTASAVAGDLIAAARHLVHGGTGIGESVYLERPIQRMEDVQGEYYVRLGVEDRPGVLAQIAAVFGSHGVSIRSVVQEGTEEEAQLVFVSHRALEGDLQATVRELREMSVVHAVKSVLRVEAEE